MSPQTRRLLDRWVAGDASDDELREEEQRMWQAVTPPEPERPAGRLEGHKGRSLLRGDLMSLRAVRIAVHPIPGLYDLDHLLAFRDLFEAPPGAGQPPVTPNDVKRCFHGLKREASSSSGREVFLGRLAHRMRCVHMLPGFPTANGLAERAFFGQLAAETGYTLDWQVISAERHRLALQAARGGDEHPLRDLLDDVASPTDPGRVPGELSPDQAAFFDPRETARSYAGSAAVLAGFCFAAIVLLINLQQHAPGRFGNAVGALLTAFLGLVLAAFLLALVAGQSRLGARTFWLAHVAGTMLATSALFALWGIADVVAVAFARVRIALDADLITLLRVVFLVASVLITAFIGATSVNLRRIAGTTSLRRATLALGASALVGVGLGLVFADWLDVSESKPIDLIAYADLIALLVAVSGALWLWSFGRLDTPKGRVATGLTLFLMLTPSMLATLLFLRLPHRQPNNRPPNCTKVLANGVYSLGLTSNSKWRTIRLSRATDPEDGRRGLHTAITAVTQDEPVKRTFVGDIGPDALPGKSKDEVLVFAEDGPDGGGRVYRIAFRVTDRLGAACSGTKIVRVPKRAAESAPANFNSFGT